MRTSGDKWHRSFASSQLPFLSVNQRCQNTQGIYYCYYYYIRLMAFFPRQPWYASTRKVNHSGFYWSKGRWGGSGISWTICKSFAPLSTPVPHHSVFTGQMPFLLPKPTASKHWRNLETLITTSKNHHFLTYCQTPGERGIDALCSPCRSTPWCQYCAIKSDTRGIKWSEEFDIRPHRHRTWVVQLYLPGGANVHPILYTSTGIHNYQPLDMSGHVMSQPLSPSKLPLGPFHFGTWTPI